MSPENVLDSADGPIGLSTGTVVEVLELRKGEREPAVAVRRCDEKPGHALVTWTRLDKGRETASLLHPT